MTESFPFHSWMPKPAGVAVLLALFVPLFFSGGTYLSNINEMAGSMGVLTEEFQFLSLCASIGMSMVFPFMVPYLRGRNVKAVYIGGYAMLALLNVVCAVSRNLPLLALCCFLIGFVRVALVLNTTFVIAPYVLGINTLDMFLHDPATASEAYRGEHARTVLMPVLYCYILCIVQFSNFVSAWVAYEFSWEYTYWLVVGMMLAAILLVMLITRSPFYWTILLVWAPLLLLLAFCCGMAVLLSALAVYFRDLQYLYGILTMAWMYATPLFYPISALPPFMVPVIKLNPLYHYINCMRCLVMYGTVPGPNTWIACIGSAVVMMGVGLAAFRKLQRNFILYL